MELGQSIATAKNFQVTQVCILLQKIQSKKDADRYTHHIPRDV
jgi:hypothetical protein